MEKIRLFSMAFNPPTPTTTTIICSQQLFQPCCHYFSTYTLFLSQTQVSLQISPLDSLQTLLCFQSLHLLVTSLHPLPEMPFFSCSCPYLSLKVWFKCHLFHEAFPDLLAGGNLSLSEHWMHASHQASILYFCARDLCAHANSECEICSQTGWVWILALSPISPILWPSHFTSPCLIYQMRITELQLLRVVLATDTVHELSGISYQKLWIDINS